METSPATRQRLAVKPGERFIRVELPWAEVSPARWLRLFPACRRWYWKNRDGSVEVAGVDALLEKVFTREHLEEAFADIRARMPAHPEAGCFGMLRFQPEPEDSAGQFVIPRWACYRSGSYQALVAHGRADENPSALLDHLRALAHRWKTQAKASILEDANGDRRILAREDIPDRKTWVTLTRLALEAIKNDSLLKVVPARRTMLTLSASMDPAAVVENLAERYSTGAFVFCASVPDGGYFLGASPERLFAQVDSMVATEALAGTAPRGQTPEADDRAGQQLLASRKNRAEHDVVVRYIMERLESLGISALKEKTRLLTLPVCHHLLTTVMGSVTGHVTDARLLTLLHPTPAVAGYPREAALAWLAEHESFDREWYAGPVGWVGWHGSEFCVGIRSALINGNQVRAYTGAGIVGHSQPVNEWDELDIKLQTILDAVTTASHGHAIT
ncbi:MAG: isochorismate synthase [Candidatus Hydrogenedentes bacterium]|nr:isochorismate synthase [Candidatus Hydrogenedentota bacterium]